MNSPPLSELNARTMKGTAAMYPETQSLTPCAPLFHTQRILVHAVATSVSVTDQMKLPAIDPPQ